MRKHTYTLIDVDISNFPDEFTLLRDDGKFVQVRKARYHLLLREGRLTINFWLDERINNEN